jgi:N-acetylmuramoyl-L-alanine amidase
VSPAPRTALRRLALLALLGAAGLAGLVLPSGEAAMAQAFTASEAALRYRDAAEAFHALQSDPAATPAQWRAVAEAFQAVHERLPPSRRSADALYSAALAQRQAWQAGGGRAELERTRAAFRAFVAAFPRDRLADDALMHLAALLAEGDGDRAAARETYRELLANHAEGDQARAARQRLDALEPAPAAAEAPRPSQADAAAPGGPRRIKRVEYWSALEWTRVILTTDPDVPFAVNRLAADDSHPERLYLDLAGARPAEDVAARIAVDDAVLAQIRIGRHQDATRVVLDLGRMERFDVKDFGLPGERKIVLDLHPPAEVVAEARRKLAPRGPPPPVAMRRAPEPPQAMPATNRLLPEPLVNVPAGLQVRAIMIDPGHGGHDPGALGADTTEKDIVLEISRRLRTLLAERHPELRVGLTREADVFIPLQERPQIARRFGADLFVSVHLNANPIQRFHGVETYFLNLTADRDALQVAARENGTTEQLASDLNAILQDLLRDTTLIESGELAKAVHGSLVESLRERRAGVRDLGVKQAPFLVLMGAEMPSVLVEAGFVTNSGENRRLQDAEYQQRIAEGIYEGLRRYIEEQTIVVAGQRAVPIAANVRP